MNPDPDYEPAPNRMPSFFAGFTIPRKRKAAESGLEFEDDSLSEDGDCDDFDEGEDDINTEYDEEYCSEPNFDQDGYDARIAALPIQPAYDPAVLALIARLVEILESLLAEIEKSSYHGEEMEDLKSLIMEHLHPKYPGELRFAIQGPAGSGKSSTINSLVDANLAAAGDHGESQTLVIQEFHASLPDQRHDVRVEVQFLKLEHCKRLIRDVLEQIFIYRHLQEDQNNPNLENPDPEVLQIARKEYDTGIEILMDIFADNEECYSFQRTEKLMDICDVEDKQQVYEMMDTKVELLLEKFNLDRRDYSEISAEFRAGDAKKLSQFLRKYTERPEKTSKSREDATRKPALWPFVEVVRTYIRSDKILPLLEQGIVLVDLPGESDSNNLRVRIAQKAQERCDASIIVSNITRVLDDATAKEQLRASYRDKGTRRTILVPTHSEVVEGDYESATKKLFGAHVKSARRLLDHQKKLQLKLAELRVQIEGLEDRNEKKLEKKKKESWVAKDELVLISRQLDEARALARIKWVKGRIAKKYKNWTNRDQDLQVYCVSNKDYKTHAILSEKADGFVLSASDTGIPQLRRALYSFPGRERFAAINHYLQNDIEIVLTRVRTECDSDRLADKEIIASVISNFESRVMGVIRKHFLDLQNLTHEFIASIRIWEEAWYEEAEKLCKTWAEMNHGTYKAHCVRYGTFEKKNYSLSWNEQLLEAPKKDITLALEEWRSKCTLCFHQTNAAVESLFRKMNLVIQDKVRTDSNASKSFRTNVTLHQQVYKFEMEKMQNDLDKKFSNNARRATKDNKIAYLYEDMKEMYKECRIIEGRGSHKKRYETFNAHVLSRCNTFNYAISRIESRGNKALETHKNDTVSVAKKMFRAMKNDLESMARDPELKFKARLLRKKLKTIEVDATKTVADGRKLLKTLNASNQLH